MILGHDAIEMTTLMDDIRYNSWGGSSGADMKIISALNMAQWDILGKAANLPVYKLLGGKYRSEQRLYNTSNAVAGMAEAYYSPIAPHNPQGPCSLAASMEVAASIPNFLILERGDNEYSDLLAKPLPPVKNGHRPLLTDPGLGITIDENKLISQVGEPRPYNTRFDSDDGSVIDW